MYGDLPYRAIEDVYSTIRSYVSRAGREAYLSVPVRGQRLDGGTWGADARVVEMERHRVADEVLRASLEAELGVDLLHRGDVEVDA